jgi:hypothetical protein
VNESEYQRMLMENGMDMGEIEFDENQN